MMPGFDKLILTRFLNDVLDFRVVVNCHHSFNFFTYFVKFSTVHEVFTFSRNNSKVEEIV